MGLFRNEMKDKPKGNARRALEVFERLREPGEGRVQEWLRCTVGSMKTKGGDGMSPCVLGLSDGALYLGKGSRWVDALRVPLTALVRVELKPYLNHSCELVLGGVIAANAVFTTASSDKPEVRSCSVIPAEYLGWLDAPVIRRSPEAEAFAETLRQAIG